MTFTSDLSLNNTPDLISELPLCTISALFFDVGISYQGNRQICPLVWGADLQPHRTKAFAGRQGNL